MKIITLISTLVFLSSCSSSAGDTRLDGTWTSNKALTLSNISDELVLSKKQLSFLKKNLGDMQYIHKGSKIAVNFSSTPIKPLQFSKYTIYESDQNSVTVGHKEIEKIKIYFAENCILHITEWGFNEYFCK